MATPELAIAKATLSATLFRADPSSLSRPAVDAFFPLVDNALSQCSRPNVQKCKAWIVDYVAPSSARSVALIKFLAALSRSLQDEGKKPSLKRRRLHLLYVVNDVLHHAIKRNGDAKFATLWEDLLPGLVANVAAFDNCPKHKAKLEKLVGLWDEKRYFTPALISKLKKAVADGVVLHSTTTTTQPLVTTSLKLAKDTPYVLPSLHGDPTMAWFDLPAATWLPHLTPNSSKPMLPDLIKPIQLARGPADETLVTSVKALLSDVERIFSKERKQTNDPYTDVNELGERVVLDEITGEIVGGTTYYGWSRGFCKKMKQRRKKENATDSGRGRSRSQSSSYSRDRSRSESPPSFKRRRLSRSRDRSEGHGRSRRHSRSYSRSRSPDRCRNRSGHRRSYSSSRSRSRTPPHHSDVPKRPPPPPQQQHPYPPGPPFPPGLPPPPADFPIPPPMTAGYRGPWPPPPPPPHMGRPPGAWFPNAGMPPQMMGGWPVPPPPPPPQHMPPQNNHFEGSRGRGGFRGRGRGGYDRGRGGW
ncbi:hypothetical protein B0T10DRAFT_481530 [Thelonectria olida]|uniref:CID domain-containing protein n=1 Tax=Thelonectria olida TaxID=1576542 RepID=A0A9P8W7J4_9HYPO|nr:hypothetical protein B0T10DRAFT_481530 [Thelonectria olida]